MAQMDSVMTSCCCCFASTCSGMVCTWMAASGNRTPPPPHPASWLQAEGCGRELLLLSPLLLCACTSACSWLRVYCTLLSWAAQGVQGWGLELTAAAGGCSWWRLVWCAPACSDSAAQMLRLFQNVLVLVLPHPLHGGCCHQQPHGCPGSAAGRCTTSPTAAPTAVRSTLDTAL